MIKTGIVLYAHFFKENFTETSVEPIWQGVKGEGCEYVACEYKLIQPPLIASPGRCGIQLFRERLSEKMFTRQSRKVIRDMINTLFLPL